MNVMRLFVQISPLMLTVLIVSSMAYANPQGLRVTEEDSARIEALKMEPAKEALVRGFVHEIRSKAEAAGLEPTDFLPPMPSEKMIKTTQPIASSKCRLSAKLPMLV